jgi:hypothetical protein
VESLRGVPDRTLLNTALRLDLGPHLRIIAELLIPPIESLEEHTTLERVNSVV